MAFTIAAGKPLIEWYPKTASTAYANASVVYVGSGTITTAINTTVVGLRITARSVASTDGDYATTNPIPCYVPTQDTLWYADVYSGTALTTSMVGNSYDLYSTTGIQVNCGATGYKQCQIIGFVSSTKAIVRFAATMLLT